MGDADLQYHVHLKPGDVGRYVLLPGDPGRSVVLQPIPTCEDAFAPPPHPFAKKALKQDSPCVIAASAHRSKKIAEFFDNPQFVASNREFTTYTGTLLGEKVSVTSTGIGCPSTAIAVEELIKVGADTFIRVGTSGGMQPGTRTGDVGVVTAAIRDEGTSRQYLPLEFPAVADPDVVHHMRAAARHLQIPHQAGVTHSKDSFFGETEKERMPMNVELSRKWEHYCSGGAICSEMEASTIFVLASIHRKRAGACNTMMAKDAHLPKDSDEMALFKGDRAIRIAIEAIKRLIKQDREDKAAVEASAASEPPTKKARK